MHIALTFEGGTHDDLQENIDETLRDRLSFPLPLTIITSNLCVVPDPDEPDHFNFYALLIVDDPSTRPDDQ
jgi:hypothetical protein